MVRSAPYPTSLRIAIVTPAPAGSLLGNRVTADRWERMLRELGHDAAIVDDADGSFDVLVALHARKSARAVERWRERCPGRPIVVALTGTDLYRDIHDDASARRCLDLADRLVVLHDRAPLDVPAEVRPKTRVVRQSADPPPPTRPPEAAGLRAAALIDRSSPAFDVAFVAHARAEKDPLRAALAARALPASSRIRIVHAGRALSSDVEALLRREARENARYTWLGEIAPAEAHALIARSKLLVLTSTLEGGANVLGEAIVAGTPPVASRIPASVAALGDDYPGLFPAGDTARLSDLFARAESDAAFYDALAEATRTRRPLFAASAERDAWRRLIDELSTARSQP